MSGCLSADQIAVYVANIASAEETASIEQHVDGCESCRRSISAAVKATRDVAGATATTPTLGRYVVIDELGAGGMGVVYRAFDPELGRNVAVKLLRAAPTEQGAEARARLAREARALAALSHPNVVTVFDIGATDDETFVAMELVTGTTLRRWLAERREPRAILDAFLQAGRGLAAAHAAGVVHRDFKPENVLVRPDGRVQVSDFGLARISGDAAASGRISDVRISDGHTATDADTRPGHPGEARSELLVTARGAVLGTLSYMAPEQVRGEPADARTDQFSFAVALCEALSGERPFPARTIEAKRAAFEDGTAPAGLAKLPAWLRPIVERALALDPAARFPSMDALVAALARDPRRARRRIAAAIALVAVASGTTAAIVIATRVGAASCASPAPRLAGIWDDARKREVHDAFLATKRPFAADSWTATEHALDAYTRDWAAAEVGACEDTRVRGTQSETMLDLRIECLDQRLAAADALVGVLVHADATVVETTPRATAQLPQLAGCNDKAALEATVRPPDDPVTAGRVAALRARLEQATALRAAGKPASAAPIADAVARDARALGYAPATAEALLLCGMLEQELDHGDPEATLTEAADAAEAGRADVTKAEAWAELVRVATARAHYPEAHKHAQHAVAVLARLGPGHDAIAAQLANYEGTTYTDEGDYDRAFELQKRALAIRERLYGSDGAEVATSLNSLGSVEFNLSHDQAARAAFERSLAIRKHVLGAHHPDVAAAESSLGTVLSLLGDRDAALAHLTEAHAIDEDVFGPSSKQVADTLGNIASVQRLAARYTECIATAKQALARYEKALGPDHPKVARMHFLVGKCYLDLKDFANAEPELRRAYELRRAKLGDTHAEVLASQSALGELAWERGDARTAKQIYEQILATQIATLGPDHADVSATHGLIAMAAQQLGDHKTQLAQFEAALANDEKRLGPEHHDVALDLVGIGDAKLGLGDAKGALPPLERAVTLAEKLKDFEPGTNGDAHLSLAMAVWNAGGDRRRARELATAARALYVSMGSERANDVRTVDRWLATHDLH